jgi:asparagine synthase (glutamine-hydrolysing)
MCGIAGWIDARGESPGVTALTAMAEAIRHRGPDGDGLALAITRDGKTEIALAHRRLAIIDLAGVLPVSTFETVSGFRIAEGFGLIAVT